jgi:hypothetical protein
MRVRSKTRQYLYEESYAGKPYDRNLIPDQMSARYPYEGTGTLTDLFMPDTHDCCSIPIISGSGK